MRGSVSWALFLTLFAAYAYFHQGGGWNQNSRFSQVRALTEGGTWSINGFCAYRARAGAGFRLERVPVPDPMPPGFTTPPLNGLDVAIYEGRIFPNKPPGTTLLALPAYAVVRAVEALSGADPEAWRTLTIGLYLTTVFSIGVLGACGCVLLAAVSRRLHPGVELRWHVAAALALGLGTNYFPFSTMLFDHVAAAVAALAGFGLVLTAAGEEQRRPRALLFAAGLVVGAGVVVNYAVAFVAALLGLYAAARLGRRAPELGFYVLGGALPALFLFWYHAHAFGGPFAIANLYQHQLFVDSEDQLLGVFSLPDPGKLRSLLVSSERGLLTSSPVLLLSIYGFYAALRRRGGRLESAFSLAVFATFLLLSASFNRPFGGNSYGPRYLLPAVPFLALYLAPAMARWPRSSVVLAVSSAALVLAVTASDPQIPTGVEHPVFERVLPGFLGSDPVSRNATGMYEAFAYKVFERGSLPARWNSFNLGELVFPQSLASLLPLLLALGGGTVLLQRLCSRAPARGSPSSIHEARGRT